MELDDNDMNNFTSSTLPPVPMSIIDTILYGLLNAFNNYIIILWLVFGFFGNILSMLIFFTKSNQDKASAGYLGPLAFFDFWNACTGVYYWLVQGAYAASNGAFGLNGYSDSDVGCWLAWFFAIFGMYMSGWIIVLFSGERCLVVWFPLKMTTILTPTKRKKAILALFAMTPLYCSVMVTHPAYFHGDETTTKGCPIKPGTPKIFEFLFWFCTTGLGSGIPCILVMIINFLILIGVRRGNREMDGHSKQRNQNEMRCLKNLLVVSTFYLIFMTPFSIFWSWSASAGDKVGFIHQLAFYSLNWATQNYCINPILYCFSLPYYRDEAMRLLTCGRVNRDGNKK